MPDDLRRAIDAIPGFVWSALPDGSVEFLNQRWCDYTGLSLPDASGEGWLAAIHPEDRPHVMERWNALLDRREAGELEARVRRSDGTFRWFSIRAVPSRDESGRLLKWYGQHTDIEERKQAEALLAGEKRLLEMVAMGRELAVVLEDLCRLVEASSGCHCSVLLVEPAGTTVRHAAAPSLPSDFSRAIDGRSVSVPYWGPCAMAIAQKTQVIVPDIGQDTRWDGFEWGRLALGVGLRSCWTTPILSQAGRPLGTFAMYRREVGSPTRVQMDLIGRFTHVTSIAVERAHAVEALRRAEDDLRQSEAFLAQAQRLSSTGSFSWRVAQGEIVWSEQTYRIYGIDPALPVTFDLVGTRIHPEEAAWFGALLVRASEEGGDLEFEHRLLMPDRSVKHLHVVAQATRDRHGQLEYVGAVRDVTERRRSEDALSKLRAELAHIARVTTLGALTASIAHEVNQPLSGIVTNAAASLLMLAASPPSIEGAVETARRTIRDANRASEVIARLRALFKKTGTASESFDLNEATREVLALSSRELQRARIGVRTELAPDLPTVVGDRVQLQQVVLNLLLNAAEAMSLVEGRPRELLVRTEPDRGDGVRLAVRDTGPGFDPSSASRLFEPFYTTKRDGMGMGLSISRSILESHQGRLWAELNDGAGATFAFSLPRVPAPGGGPMVAPGQPPELHPSPPFRPAAMTGATLPPAPVVYVVDDDVSVRESLAALIRCAGWRPETFCSAHDFLTRARDDGPSCLVLDVELPDLDGLDLQEIVAADRADLPIIFVTGYGDIPMSVRAMKAGAAEFMTKPFEPQALLSAIRRALDGSRASAAGAAEVKKLRERYASLTPREREVLAWVVAGLLNKQVGAQLGMSEATVKAHRGQVMQKMKADSLAELVRIAARLEIPLPARAPASPTRRPPP